uniref:Uncharacterized protein n=1 Tax=Oryza sativa subsp. japonica TaxID=39947 RepID=Q33AM3_ORYSJ|nr:hypothetical protein LOC_Os10g09260 [Oryza sativa Japonica Group]
MPNHFSVDHLSFCASQPPERDHANDALEHAPERRRFDIVVDRPFLSIPKQAAVPRISPRPPLQDASRTLAGVVKDSENASFASRRRSRIASAIIVDYRCLGEPLFDSSRIHHLHNLTNILDMHAWQVLELFEPSPFPRGGALPSNRSNQSRCYPSFGDFFLQLGEPPGPLRKHMHGCI